MDPAGLRGGFGALWDGVGLSGPTWRTCPGAPYPPHIWAGYGGCRSARAFEARLRRPSGSKKRDQLVNGRLAQAYEPGLRCPVVDALTGAGCQTGCRTDEFSMHALFVVVENRETYVRICSTNQRLCHR